MHTKEALEKEQIWSYSYFLPPVWALIAHYSLIRCSSEQTDLFQDTSVRQTTRNPSRCMCVYIPTPGNITGLSEILISLFKSCARTDRN